ncbi:hypothetical protein TGRH88_019340 [Toxoplasma gondii]|uniref:Uncharacterized protein n=1 Tax=Toxoplasma gondii TaxID=5811 RepID=A0A7J6KG79_TOXGO|nr:hypothetical protein TGRH88_019340 [Toxoplasma gondii]
MAGRFIRVSATLSFDEDHGNPSHFFEALLGCAGSDSPQRSSTTFRWGNRIQWREDQPREHAQDTLKGALPATGTNTAVFTSSVAFGSDSLTPFNGGGSSTPKPPSSLSILLFWGIIEGQCKSPQGSAYPGA